MRKLRLRESVAILRQSSPSSPAHWLFQGKEGKDPLIREGGAGLGLDKDGQGLWDRPPPPPQSVPLLASAFPSPLPHQLPCWLPGLYSPGEPVWEEPLKGGWLRWHAGLAMVTFPSGHCVQTPHGLWLHGAA